MDSEPRTSPTGRFLTESGNRLLFAPKDDYSGMYAPQNGFYRFERHHALYSRGEWAKTPLSKQVRQMSAFIIECAYPNHRLLHISMKPPEVPRHETLLWMRHLALEGIDSVIKNIGHPIGEHLADQLTIVHMQPEEAQYILDRGFDDD